MQEASLKRKKNGSVELIWDTHLGRRASLHPSSKVAREEYYIQTAYDYYGSAIRDNTREEKIQLGKHADKHGIDE